MSTIIFVYNADSGLVNLLKDWAHKITSPKTYQCNLCALTFNNLGMRSRWRGFVRGLGIPAEFLHRDELDEKYSIRDVALPAVFMHNNGSPKLWLTADEMNACGSLQDLQTLVQNKMTQEETPA